MTVPAGLAPTLADCLQGLEDRLALLEGPMSPSLAYACLKAALPPAADFINCVAYVTDTKILVASDGTVWRRQDTGAAI